MDISMRKNIYSGKFIVVEGLDGSGQTTEAELLKNYLKERGYKVVLTKEPTLDSEAGRKIRKVLDKEIVMEPNNLQKLFVEDRKEHLEKVIIPALKDDRIVISDRYFFSTFAYGAAEDLDLEWLIKINDHFLLPDLTLILKVSPAICIERIEERDQEKTLFEKKEKLAKVWKTYSVMPEKFENIHIVDGEGTIEGVFEKIKNIIDNKLEL